MTCMVKYNENEKYIRIGKMLKMELMRCDLVWDG